MRTGQINRLTDGPNQAANLSWSPDSQWIVHEEVESFGTGAGWNVKAVWAAAPDGNQTRKIYDAPQYSGGEQIIGWTAPDTFIAYTWRTMGPTAVREINVNTGAATPIELAILTQGDWIDLVWSSLAEQFYLYTANSVSGVGWNDQVTRFAQEALLPAVSPDGQHLAFWINSRYGSQYGQRDGLRVYALDGRLQHSVSDQPVDFATWRPDSSGLYFLSDGVLYYAALPAGQITPITDRVQITFEGGLGWVQP
jgi:Tol biopolymer transport system component